MRGAAAAQRANPRKVPERTKQGGLRRTLIYAMVEAVREAHAEA